MPGQFSAALMFVSLAAIALAANRAEEVNEMARSTREPASISVAAIQKEEVLNSSYRAEPIMVHTEKMHGPLFVKIERVGAAPKAIGDVFVIRATVSSQKSLSNVDFSWSIPGEVELVTGVNSGRLDSITPQQPGVLEMTLRKLAAANAQVHLLVGTTQGEARFGDTAQFNTDLQEQVDAQKEEMKKNTMTAAPAKPFKVMH